MTLFQPAIKNCFGIKFFLGPFFEHLATFGTFLSFSGLVAAFFVFGLIFQSVGPKSSQTPLNIYLSDDESFWVRSDSLWAILTLLESFGSWAQFR